MEIRIGTSGWHYDHWRGPFYPEKLPATRMLDFYLERFDSVEINNLFYRLARPETVAAWRDAAPRGFVFAVKGSRYLTHMKKLKDPEAGLGKFLPVVEVLGEKLGPILFQLPGHWGKDPGRLAAFLEALPPRHRYAFELRDESWHAKDVYQLLARHGAAFCAWELAGVRSPIEITADFAYVRLHGPGGPYQGSYSSQALSAWARRIRGWRTELTTVYVYFDNDQAGYATKNALALKKMIQPTRSLAGARIRHGS